MKKKSTEMKPAARIHNALTAEVEKRVLIWMAGHTPRRIHSDHLTALALGAQLSAGASYAMSGRSPFFLWIASFFLALNWLGDSLDGTLARVRNQQRPRYGFYVDHIADTYGAAALIAGLAWSGYLHWQIAIGMLLCFYALSIESYLATYTLGRFHLSHGVFGPTEIRILLVVGNSVAYFHPHTIGRWLLFDVGGAVAIAGMVLMMITASVRNTTQLYREEPAP